MEEKTGEPIRPVSSIPLSYENYKTKQKERKKKQSENDIHKTRLEQDRTGLAQKFNISHMF